MPAPTETPEERRKRLLALTEHLGPGITPPPVEGPKYDKDLIPEVEKTELSEEDIRLDNFIQEYDILEGYRTFIGKMNPGDSGHRSEGIMISCPMPDHPDKTPSAWANTEKRLWFCGGCQVGGDIFDLGAIHFGYDINTYKRNGTFPKLKRQMAERLGFTVVKGITGQKYYVAPAPEPAPAPAPIPAPTPVVVHEELAQVHRLHVVEDDEPVEAKMLLEHSDLIIDWDKLLPPKETYLRSWLQQTTIDDLPHEYYLWQGLQALAFAGGNNVYMADFKNVKLNLYVCLYGRTGVGKSRSISPFMDVLNAAMPYDDSDISASPSGIKMISTPASAEALLDQLKHEIKDPSTMQTTDLGMVSGLIKIEEFSAFVARASRQGSSIKELIIELYDVMGSDLTLHGRTAGTVRVRNPFIQMVTTTQPKAIHAFLRRTDTESGMLNRWIFAAGRARRAPMSYGGVQYDISRPADLLRQVHAWALTGHRYVLAGAALDTWDTFFHDELAKFKTGEVEMESMFSRIDLTLKKLIALFTLDEMLAQPTRETVERAIALYPYLALTYSAFSGDIAFNDVTECQNKIMDVIEGYQTKKNELPTARNIRQYLNNRYDAELIIRAMKNLVALDVLYEEVSAGRGRPTKKYGLSTFGVK